jgi:uncharacterized protein YbcI
MSIRPEWEAPDGLPQIEFDGSSGYEPASRASSPLLQISNATVRLYKTAFGRGPTYARTRFAGADTLVVLLQDTMTISERRLADLGEHERLREDRLVLHQTLEPEIRAAVERILDRTTVGLISGIDTHRDLAAEVITLAPVPAPRGLDGAG